MLLSRALALILVALAVTACSTPLTATVDHDPNFDFNKVRKIAIQPIDRTVVSTVVISDMQVARINEAFTDELSRRGFEVVQNNADADVFMSWHLVTQERMDVRTYNTTAARYTSCWHCGPSSGTDVSVRQYTQGTLIVDMIDPTRLQSVWRSIIQSRLRDTSDPEAAAERRREAAAAIFEGFPP
jgi:hypothetical protein